MTINPQPTVLLLGATGRTGSRVLAELTRRRVPVRAIVRSVDRVEPSLRACPDVTLIEGEVLSLDDATLRAHLEGCDAVISCLGHVLSLRGVFGEPRQLVTRAVERVCEAVEALAPPRPVRLALMSSVSVNRPSRQDTRRGLFERAFLAVLRWLLPPARDNQTAADLLVERAPSSVEWVVVRPDTLMPGEPGPYSAHEGIVDGLFSPGHSRMNNVASFLVDLVTDEATFRKWQGRMPVIVDAPAEDPAVAPAAAR